MKYQFFKSRAGAVDADLIYEDLNYENPLALVIVEGAQFIVIHKTIFFKMGCCAGGAFYKDELEAMMLQGFRWSALLPVVPENVGKIKEVIGKVRAAKYLPGYAKPVKVEVQILNCN